MDVGDGALWKVNVESQEVKVFHSFQPDGITKEAVVDEGLDGWVGEEVFVVHNEAVVNKSVVREVECCVLEKIVVKLVPRVFDQGNGDIAEGRRVLGANPSPSNLLVGVVACPENTGVQCKSDNGSDVGRVEGALCGMYDQTQTHNTQPQPQPHTLMDMRTDLTAVPHASLRNPNPERSRKALKSLGVFKRK